MQNTPISDGAPYPPTFAAVLEVQNRLLASDGCPWDREQTPITLKAMLREECHELLDALAERDVSKIVEETGDVLINVLFQMRLASDVSALTFADVYQTAAANLMRCANAAAPSRREGIYAALESDVRLDAQYSTSHITDFTHLQSLAADMFGETGALRTMDAAAFAPIVQRGCYALMQAVHPVVGGSERSVCGAAGAALAALAMMMQAGEHAGEHTAADVFGALVSKLTRRHPHVFGDVRADSTDEVLTNWDAIKRSEKPADASVLDGVPHSLPPLAYAQAVQRRAARLGFDWLAYDDVVGKVDEELAELHAAYTPHERSAEFGDLLFSAVNAARWLHIDAESALDWWNRQRYRNFFEICPDASGDTAAAIEKISARMSEKVSEELSSANQTGMLGALRFAQRFQAALNARGAMHTSGQLAAHTHPYLQAELERLPPLDDGADGISAYLRALHNANGISADAVDLALSHAIAALAGTADRMGVDAHDALCGANRRFYHRFATMERSARRQGLDFKALPLDDKEALWQAAKCGE